MIIALGVLLLVFCVVGVFLAVASRQPAAFSLSRAIKINASPERCFALVNDFHCWDQWSPWAKTDPNMKVTFAGAAKGEGAVYLWSGNSKAGEGKMTILKSQATRQILIALQFTRPMKATNQSEFAFAPEGQGTEVRWTMTGTNNLMAKAFHLVMNLEKMLGPDFDRGLAQLKASVEKASA